MIPARSACRRPLAEIGPAALQQATRLTTETTCMSTGRKTTPKTADHQARRAEASAADSASGSSSSGGAGRSATATSPSAVPSASPGPGAAAQGAGG